ncbi:MAG: DUF6111 family protein [Parvibaculales bacterium]
MIRILLWSLLVFSLPFLVALFWLAVVKRTKPSEADLKIWAVAGSAGLVLLLASLFWWRGTLGVSTEYIYVPAEMRDGELVPGYFAPVELSDDGNGK